MKGRGQIKRGSGRLPPPLSTLRAPFSHPLENTLLNTLKKTRAGAILASVPALAIVLLLYRRDLLGAIPNYADCLKATADYRILDWDLLAKAGYVTGVVVIGFLLVGGGARGLSVGAAGAAVLREGQSPSNDEVTI